MPSKGHIQGQFHLRPSVHDCVVSWAWCLPCSWCPVNELLSPTGNCCLQQSGPQYSQIWSCQLSLKQINLLPSQVIVYSRLPHSLEKMVPILVLQFENDPLFAIKHWLFSPKWTPFFVVKHWLVSPHEPFFSR